MTEPKTHRIRMSKGDPLCDVIKEIAASSTCGISVFRDKAEHCYFSMGTVKRDYEKPTWDTKGMEAAKP